MSTISKRRLRKRNRTSKIWISIIILLLVGGFSVQTYSLHSEGKGYTEKEAQLKEKLEQEKQRTKDIEQEEKYRQTKKYVEDYAHNQLGLVYPGEIIFKSAD